LHNAPKHVKEAARKRAKQSNRSANATSPDEAGPSKKSKLQATAPPPKQQRQLNYPHHLLPHRFLFRMPLKSGNSHIQALRTPGEQLQRPRSPSMARRRLVLCVRDPVTSSRIARVHGRRMGLFQPSQGSSNAKTTSLLLARFRISSNLPRCGHPSLNWTHRLKPPSQTLFCVQILSPSAYHAFVCAICYSCCVLSHVISLPRNFQITLV
jgi:hypothetical protein